MGREGWVPYFFSRGFLSKSAWGVGDNPVDWGFKPTSRYFLEMGQPQRRPMEDDVLARQIIIAH